MKAKEPKRDERDLPVKALRTVQAAGIDRITIKDLEKNLATISENS